MLKIEANAKGLELEIEGDSGEILASLSTAVLCTVKQVAKSSNFDFQKMLKMVLKGLEKFGTTLEACETEGVVVNVERQS